MNVLAPEQTVQVTMWGNGTKPDLAHELMRGFQSDDSRAEGRGTNRIELEGIMWSSNKPPAEAKLL
jgi:hypothetical protein